MIAIFLASLVATAPLTLTPEQAVALALENNPIHAVHEATLKETRAEAGLALRLKNPELRVGDFRSDLLISPLVEGRALEAPFEGTRFGVRWKPPALEDFGPRQARADARIRQREAQLEDSAIDLAARVHKLHALVRNLDARIALATVGLDLADRLRKAIHQRAEEALSTQLDTSLSELEYLDAAADLEELRAKARLARREFLATLGLDARTEFALTAPDGVACTAHAEGVDAVIDEAKANSPQLRAMDAQIDEVNAELFATWLAFAPWFDFVQVAYSAGGVNTPGEARVRLGITVPLFDFQRDDAAVLRARRARHEAERRAVALDIGADVRKSIDDVNGQADLANLYSTSQREVLDAGLRELENALERGDADFVEVALLRTRVIRAKRALLQTEFACEEAAITLARRTGRLTSAALVDAPAAPPRDRLEVGNGATVAE